MSVMSVVEEGDNEVVLRTLPRSPSIHLMAEENLSLESDGCVTSYHHKSDPFPEFVRVM